MIMDETLAILKQHSKKTTEPCISEAKVAKEGYLSSSGALIQVL
jgi:hypothetical protein